MRIFTTGLLLFVCCLLPETGFAQRHLNGLWEGILIDSAGVEHRFELLIKLSPSGKIKGTSFYHELDGEVVEMDFQGQYHYDRSISLYDEHWLNRDEIDDADVRPRAYQMVYQRSVFGLSLEGYWQENNRQVLGALRHQHGRIKLTKNLNKA